MDLAIEILGKATVDTLRVRGVSAILTIGKDTFTRGELSKVGCYNFTAAARLSAILTDEFSLTDTKDLFQNVPPIALAIRGLGAISLATLGAAFEAKKLGTLADYINDHAAADAATVTFSTMKHHAENTKRERRRRATAKKKPNGARVYAHH